MFGLIADRDYLDATTDDIDTNHWTPLGQAGLRQAVLACLVLAGAK